MKRYVKEFGKAMYNAYYKLGKDYPELDTSQICTQISKAIRLCEKGYTTDYEAVKTIVKICEEAEV